jgi:hypothetical protein
VDGASVVVQDCLSICRNILQDSETCQRLFFGMGTDWTLRLSEYFTPYFLERPANDRKTSEYEDGEDTFWADKMDFARCSYLAMDALVSALSIPNPKHQKLVAIDVTDVLPSAMFWVARGGPSYLIHSGLCLLNRCMNGNKPIAAQIMNMSLQLSPSIPGRNIPQDGATDASGRMHDLLFGWKPLPNDDRKCIAIVSLLAERYVYAQGAWCGQIAYSAAVGSPPPSGHASFDSSIEALDVSTGDGFSQSCLQILDTVFAADSGMTSMLIQCVLAPPPPLPDDDEHEGMTLESMKPLCSILFALILDVCHKISDPSNVHYVSSPQSRVEMDIAERAANILTLVFLHGESLTREITTALSTVHIASSGYPIKQQVSRLYLIERRRC